MKIRVGIITVSDKGSAGLREDKSGPMIRECLRGMDHEVVWYGIVPDEQEQIELQLRTLCDQLGVDVVFTTGGTGLSPRDVTPEATQAVSDKMVPGISEAMRIQSAEKAPRSMLSRGVSAIRGRTLIINFPGSPKAVCECMEIVTPVLEHAISVLEGTVSECAASV